jgi:hypothetical protein
MTDAVRLQDVCSRSAFDKTAARAPGVLGPAESKDVVQNWYPPSPELRRAEQSGIYALGVVSRLPSCEWAARHTG